jgi:hypothetical protein
MRSYSRRRNGTHIGYPVVLQEKFVYPMTYPVAEAYTHHEFYQDDRRDFDILCTSCPCPELQQICHHITHNS